MPWTLWILTSAVFLAAYDLAKKASVRENAVLPVLLCGTAIGCVTYFAALACTGVLRDALVADGRIILLASVKSVIVASSWIFTFQALRTLPITLATPIRASSPVLVFLMALFLFGERPSCAQGIGMLCVFVGYWLFSWAGRHEGIDFLRNRAVWCAFAGMTLSSFSSIWDKYVFQFSGAGVETIQAYFQLGLFIVYALCYAFVRVIPALRARAPRHVFQWRWTIPAVGVLLTAADWLYFHGLAVPDVPISVASLLRRFSVVLTFAVGALVFHEHNLRRKGLALVLVLVGIALLVV